MKIQGAVMLKRNSLLVRQVHRRHHQLQKALLTTILRGENISFRRTGAVFLKKCTCLDAKKSVVSWPWKSSCWGTKIPLGSTATTRSKVCTAGGGLQQDHHEFVGRFLKFFHRDLTCRHRASCILGQAFHYSPEKAFYILNQQIYFITWYLLDRASLI